jgi:hypothetical protein
MPAMFSVPITLELIDSKFRPSHFSDKVRLIGARMGTDVMRPKNQVLWLDYTASSDESWEEWMEVVK